MDYEVIWTDPASEAFETVVRQIAAENPVAAEKVRQGILGRVGSLARLPLLGAEYEGDPTGRAREVLSRPYRVFYRVDESRRRIEVLTIWHASRAEPDLS